MKSGACCSIVAVSSQVGLLHNPFSSQVRGRLLHESPLSDSRERSTLKAKRPDGNHNSDSRERSDLTAIPQLLPPKPLSTGRYRQPEMGSGNRSGRGKTGLLSQHDR